MSDKAVVTCYPPKKKKEKNLNLNWDLKWRHIILNFYTRGSGYLINFFYRLLSEYISCVFLFFCYKILLAF